MSEYIVFPRELLEEALALAYYLKHTTITPGEMGEIFRHTYNSSEIQKKIADDISDFSIGTVNIASILEDII